MATLVSRPVKRRTDDVFFVTMSLVILAVVFIGFAPSYFLRGAVFAHLPSVLIHIHGAAFTTWILLFVVQTVLVARKKIRLHRTLGTFGGFLAVAMLVLGTMVTLASVSVGRVPPFFAPGMFLVLNIGGMIVFAALVGWAILRRNNGPVHKRLMLLATYGLIPPAVGRLPIAQAHPPLIGGCLFLFVFALVAFDLFTRRKPYAVTIIGGLIVLAVFPMANILGATPPLKHAAAALQHHSEFPPNPTR